jgi:hypothetical protein
MGASCLWQYLKSFALFSVHMCFSEVGLSVKVDVGCQHFDKGQRGVDRD